VEDLARRGDGVAAEEEVELRLFGRGDEAERDGGVFALQIPREKSNMSPSPPTL